MSYDQLPGELRDMIWLIVMDYEWGLLDRAIFSYAQQYRSLNKTIGARACLRSRLFQVFNPDGIWGNDTKRKCSMRQPLRLWVSDHGGKLRLGKNEFEILVNKFSISRLSCDGRSYAIDYCCQRVNTVDLCYTPSSIFNGVEVVDNVLVQPKTVTVSRAYDRMHGLEVFGSADRLTSIIEGLFGDSVEHIIFRTYLDPPAHKKQIWWPHTELTKSLLGPRNFKLDPDALRLKVSMTPERTGTVSKDTFKKRGVGARLDSMWIHLLKFQEVLEACRHQQRLVHLASMEMDLYHSSDGDSGHIPAKCMNFVGAIEDGTLWVNWEEVKGHNTSIARGLLWA